MANSRHSVYGVEPLKIKLVYINNIYLLKDLYFIIIYVILYLAVYIKSKRRIICATNVKVVRIVTVRFLQKSIVRPVLKWQGIGKR